MTPKWPLPSKHRQIIRFSFVAIKNPCFYSFCSCLSDRISTLRIVHPQKNTSRIERRMEIIIRRKWSNPIIAFHEKGIIFHCLEECREETLEPEYTSDSHLRINDTLHHHWLSIIGDNDSRRCQRDIALRLIAVRFHRAASVHWHRWQEKIRIRTGGFHHTAVATSGTLQKTAIGETFSAAVQRTLIQCRTVMLLLLLLSTVRIRVGRDGHGSFDPDLTASLIEIGLTTWWCRKTSVIRRRIQFGSRGRIAIGWRRWFNFQQLQ